MTLDFLPRRLKTLRPRRRGLRGSGIRVVQRTLPPTPVEPELVAGRPAVIPADRVRVNGKFFQVAGRKWYLKGLTYGPFAPNAAGLHLPEPQQMADDFRHIAALGGNCVRLYHLPPRSLLDAAWDAGLRVFVDVPWEKHRCFFEDWSSQEDARRAVRRAAVDLGDHPALFAISVVNELPADVCRFYGHRRVERFVDQLIDIVKQASPDCLATFANYPSTEFLQPQSPDFTCFNVYLQDPTKLEDYLDRLQHLAGPRPLILGEFGLDSIRNGDDAQAASLRDHVDCVFGRGLAGSFVFAYTDDWYTGGHQITDWAFGVTRADRTDKPAATALRESWSHVPRPRQTKPPRVSVVVCSYNGAATLDECLVSLQQVRYPDYEVILVDDGSTDNTPAIAKRFPWVRYIRQVNKGLSVARNVGAQAATGEIVAYTDSDCVADPEWLHYLVEAMQRQEVDAIGGPNVPPASDCWIAKCVAASPGGPSHVMLDDRRAEHVPGCNMAFRRQTLLDLGGFDAQFRQAGDDVDICWRFMDAGHTIGYAPAALVWHHRRTSVRAYLKQQKGYGRSEAMLLAKHPRRFNKLGASLWNGTIYGEGAVGLPLVQPVIHHGRFGKGLFQSIYARNEYSTWALFTLLEWHAVAALHVGLGFVAPPLWVVAAVMWTLTLAAAWRTTRAAVLPKTAPTWCRPLVFALHLMQPAVRAWHRYRTRLGGKRLPTVAHGDAIQPARRTGFARYDLYWMSHDNRGREDLLDAVEAECACIGWRGLFDEEYQPWDVLLLGDRWHNATLRTATEELGWPKRFTRARLTPKLTTFAKVVTAATIAAGAIGAAASLSTGHVAPALVALSLVVLLAGRLTISRRRVVTAATALLARCAASAKLTAEVVERVDPSAPSPAAATAPV